MRYIKSFLIICTAILVLNPAISNAGMSDRIEGIAEFLINRARDNYLYIFEENLRQNEDFQCYFPATYNNLKYAGLKELLLFSEDLWKDSLEKDLNFLLTRAFASSLENTLKLSEKSSSVWNDYYELLNYLEVEFSGNYYSLTSLPIDAKKTNPELVSIVNNFYINTLAVSDSLRFFKSFEGKTICETPMISSETFLKNIEPITSTEDTLKNITANFVSLLDKNRLRLSDEGKAHFEQNLKDRLNRTIQPFENMSPDVSGRVKELCDLSVLFADGTRSMTAKVIAAFSFIDEQTDLKLNKVQRFVMFFAQISDAAEKNDGAKKVAEVLKAYTLPSVSFFEKRNNKVLAINAYLGVVAATADVPQGETDSGNLGIFAPIGLEYSWPVFDGDSLSIMVAPFDLGYPVTLKLSGTESDFEFDEIIAPSITLTFGFRNYPIAMGVGYQRGRSFTFEENSEEKYFAHLSFDMPLFNFFLAH